MIQVVCPHCAVRLTVSESVGGTVMQCPRCAKWMEVDDGPPPPPEPQPEQRIHVSFGGPVTWRSDFKVLLLMGGVIVFATVGIRLLTWLGSFFSRVPTGAG